MLIVCLDDDRSEMSFFRLAHSKGMLAPDYVFIGNGNIPDEELFRPWSRLDLAPDQIEEWKKTLVEINLKQVGSLKIL